MLAFGNRIVVLNKRMASSTFCLGKTEPAARKDDGNEISAARRGRGAGKPAPIHPFYFITHFQSCFKGDTTMPEENGNTIDYGAVLADLEARKAAIDAAIASIRAAMGTLSVKIGDSTGQMANTAPIVNLRGVQEVPAGSFFKKSIIEATKLYLSLVKKKQTTHEIVGALKQGGMESTSKDFVGMTGIVLHRASKKSGERDYKIYRWMGIV